VGSVVVVVNLHQGLCDRVDGDNDGSAERHVTSPVLAIKPYCYRTLVVAIADRIDNCLPLRNGKLAEGGTHAF
jgi:hypothetical protein